MALAPVVSVQPAAAAMADAGKGRLPRLACLAAAAATAVESSVAGLRGVSRHLRGVGLADDGNRRGLGSGG